MRRRRRYELIDGVEAGQQGPGVISADFMSEATADGAALITSLGVFEGHTAV